VKNLWLAGELQREEIVAAAVDGLTQGRRGPREESRETVALEFPSFAEQLTRRGVAVEHGVSGVGEHHGQRCGLDHGVEHELALIQALALDAQPVAETVVHVDQLTELIVGSARHADAEIPIPQAGDAVGERARHAAPALGDDAATPGRQRNDDQRSQHRGQPGGLDESPGDEVRENAEQRDTAQPQCRPAGHGGSHREP
jgi:hypothetical protein